VSRTAGATYSLSCEAQRRGQRATREDHGARCIAQRGPRTDCHAKHSDEGRGRRVRTMGRGCVDSGGATYTLSCEAQRGRRAREDGEARARRSAVATYILSCEAQRRGRRATREDGRAAARHAVGATYSAVAGEGAAGAGEGTVVPDGTALSWSGVRTVGGGASRSGATYTLSCREAQRRGRRATREDGVGREGVSHSGGGHVHPVMRSRATWEKGDA
jgi:hypothetical protein